MDITQTNSVQSAHRGEITEQPTRLSRWWMRHYQHIGLASLAGSAILVCIIVMILLPIFLRESSNNSENCSTAQNISYPSFPSIRTSTTTSKPLTSTTTLWSTTSRLITPDPLCPATAVWKREGVTVAGSSLGVSSSTLSGLEGPTDILIDHSGNLFIADTGNDRIVCWLKNATQGRIVAGIGFAGSWNNSFNGPSSILVWNDQLIVSDTKNYRILSFPFTIFEGSPEGVTIIGRHGAGSLLTQVNLAYFITMDRTRQIFYVSDFRNHRILKLNLTTNSMQIAFGTGSFGATNTTLNSPLGLTVEQTSGAVYIADFQNHRIQRFDLNSDQARTVAGGQGRGSNLTQLATPSNIALDLYGNIYVADTNNNRIVQWLVGATQGRLIAGNGTTGVSNIQLNYPTQLKFDWHHNLYVVDQNNHRIQRFDLISNGC